jgi:hypothetical protein
MIFDDPVIRHRSTADTHAHHPFVTKGVVRPRVFALL